MNHPALALSAALLGLAPAVGAAQTCEAIQARIDAKIRASGVKAFTLRTVDAAAKVDGKVVAAARPDKEAILTECKDGSVSMGGDCRKQP
jgi:hypothetical protein